MINAIPSPLAAAWPMSDPSKWAKGIDYKWCKWAGLDQEKWHPYDNSSQYGEKKINWVCFVHLFATQELWSMDIKTYSGRTCDQVGLYERLLLRCHLSQAWTFHSELIVCHAGPCRRRDERDQMGFTSG